MRPWSKQLIPAKFQAIIRNGIAPSVEPSAACTRDASQYHPVIFLIRFSWRFTELSAMRHSLPSYSNFHL